MLYLCTNINYNVEGDSFKIKMVLRQNITGGTTADRKTCSKASDLAFGFGSCITIPYRMFQSVGGSNYKSLTARSSLLSHLHFSSTIFTSDSKWKGYPV